MTRSPSVATNATEAGWRRNGPWSTPSIRRKVRTAVSKVRWSSLVSRWTRMRTVSGRVPCRGGGSGDRRRALASPPLGPVARAGTPAVLPDHTGGGGVRVGARAPVRGLPRAPRHLRAVERARGPRGRPARRAGVPRAAPTGSRRARAGAAAPRPRGGGRGRRLGRRPRRPRAARAGRRAALRLVARHGGTAPRGRPPARRHRRPPPVPAHLGTGRRLAGGGLRAA